MQSSRRYQFLSLTNHFSYSLLEDWDENDRAGEENMEWEDNWDDEVEGEDDFSKRLRAELAATEQEK